ncbi:MAG: purine-nucleoside phosphorylase [Cyanobacteria bacterium P01_H01_bin.74]
MVIPALQINPLTDFTEKDDATRSLDSIEAAVAMIHHQFKQKFKDSSSEAFGPNGLPKITKGVVLGSGLGDLPHHFTKGLQQEKQQIVCKQLSLPYAEIPFFQTSQVVGHSGNLTCINHQNHWIAFLQGRFHYYEGHSMAQVVFPVRVLKALGVETLIVTNAAGGINPNYSPGSLMLIRDHLNLMGCNPLIGQNIDALGDRFPDLSAAYALPLRAQAKCIAERLNIALEEGVYAGVTGPSYETPAEIKMLALLGADAVGMSTVPEVIAANHMGLNVLGISCITNPAAGISKARLNHTEVVQTAQSSSATLCRLLTALLKEEPAASH